jgi:DnaJ-domain-containing protein 1
LTILHPDSFDILALPPRFDLKPGEIQRAYLALAAQAHPDSNDAGTDLSDGLEDEADGVSAALNAAKDLLLDDEARANLLLARLGGLAAHQDRTLPPTLLMEMMEKRSEFEEAKSRGDSGAMGSLRAWADEQRNARVAAVGGLFADVLAAGQRGAGAADKLKQLRVELNAWRYVERMLEQVG